MDCIFSECFLEILGALILPFSHCFESYKDNGEKNQRHRFNYMSFVFGLVVSIYSALFIRYKSIFSYLEITRSKLLIFLFFFLFLFLVIENILNVIKNLQSFFLKLLG